MGVDKGGRVGRALMLALGMLNPLASSALLTGGISSIAAATLLGGFSWLHWFGLMAVPYYALILLGGLYLRVMVGKFEPPVASATVPPAVPLSTAETRTLVVLALTTVLWLTDSWHHLSPATPALIAAIALLCPPFGVLSWKAFEAKLSWGLILTVGASISLARAMTERGAAAWLGELLVGPLVALSTAPLVLWCCPGGRSCRCPWREHADAPRASITGGTAVPLAARAVIVLASLAAERVRLR